MFLVAVIALSTPAYAQLGSIVGTVVDKDGKRLSDATVTFDRPEVKYHFETKTDKNGNYSKMGMEDGSYQVTISQNGKVVASAEVVVSLGFRVDKAFDLRNPNPIQAPGGPSAAVNKALQDAEKKLNTDTGGAYNAGVAALNAKNFDEAIKQFSLATQKQPKSYLVFGRLAEANKGAKKNAEAIDAYKKAIDLKNYEANYRFELGMLLVQGSSMTDAAAQFEKYLQLAPKGENAETAKQLLDAAKK